MLRAYTERNINCVQEDSSFRGGRGSRRCLQLPGLNYIDGMATWGRRPRTGLLELAMVVSEEQRI